MISPSSLAVLLALTYLPAHTRGVHPHDVVGPDPERDPSQPQLPLSEVSSSPASTSDSPLPHSAPCRDQNLWPFTKDSIWNTPLGTGAEFSPANIFHDILPKKFFSDDDYFFTTAAADPQVPWYSQGWWYNESHCDIKGPLHGTISFPSNVTVTQFGNNAAAILMPDNRTLVLTQPLYVCTPGGPFLSHYDAKHGLADIRSSNGTWGGHGGSSLSAIGGTIRRFELLPNSPPIRHALKLQLYAHDYYYGKEPCYHWPALVCDGYAFNCSEPTRCYNGSNPLLTPGALLAIPPADVARVNASLRTLPAQMLLFALANYGGYLVDDTATNRGTICLEHGLTDDFNKAWGFPFDATPTSGGVFYQDMLTLFQALQIVVNNTPETVGGGGTPLQPSAPDFC